MGEFAQPGSHPADRHGREREAIPAAPTPSLSDPGNQFEQETQQAREGPHLPFAMSRNEEREPAPPILREVQKCREVLLRGSFQGVEVERLRESN